MAVSLMHFLLLLCNFEVLALSSHSGSKLDFEDAAVRPVSHLRPTLAASVASSSAGNRAYDDYEDEAAAIDAELALSQRLIVNAWDVVRRAPLPGAANLPNLQGGIVQRLSQFVQSAPPVEWYIFLVALLLMISVDFSILQHLPEIERTHLGLFIFWLLIASAFCAEVWLRLGETAGITWAAGYLLELVYSMEVIFIFNLIIHTLETPRRLMRKVLFVSTLGAILLKFAFSLGLAEAMYRITIAPYVLGAWLIYCGSQQLSHNGSSDEELRDVTQTLMVRVLRKVLGKRLAEYYDEEGEAIFMYSGDRYRINLLGVAVFSLLLAVFFFSPDATLVKLNVIPNAYICFSSSVLALLTLRALFFVVRDVLTHFSFARYGTSLIFFFVGSQMIIARFTEVSAMMSLIVVVNVMMCMAVLSALKDSACPKRVT